MVLLDIMYVDHNDMTNVEIDYFKNKNLYNSIFID